MRIILRKIDISETDILLGTAWFKNAQSWKGKFNAKTEAIRILARERYKICLENAYRFLGFYSIEDMLAYKKLHGDF